MKPKKSSFTWLFSPLAGISVILAAASTAYADLLFYEDFNSYPAGDLDGQEGWNATGAQVQTSNFTDDQGTSWNGVITAIPTSGGGFIAQSGTASYDRALTSTVTDSFVPGTTTWFSFVAFQGWNGANARWAVTIGADVLGGTGGGFGNEMNGQGLGAGQLDQSSGAEAHYWIPNADGSDRTTSGFFSGGRPVFTMLKIDWAADGSNDTITMFRWDQNFASTPTLTDWDNASKLTVSVDLDQSTFDTLSILSNYGFIDEVRIATTFDEAVTGTDVGTTSGPVVTSITKSGSTVTVVFKGANGQTYGLNKSTTLDFSTTPDIKDTELLSDTTTGTLVDTTASEDVAFYRVEQQ